MVVERLRGQTTIVWRETEGQTMIVWRETEGQTMIVWRNYSIYFNFQH